MDKLISMVNQLQDAFAILGTEPMSLPQIAVVGGQSAGKSSVLENVVGKDFLPRGSGIVTRRPLVLQLVNVPGLKNDYAEFLHCKDKPFFDFEQVRAEIAAETDRETGDNKGISNKPINLKVFSATVLNLTLIDLPGITRVAVGDQPKNIEELIRQMVLGFIQKENCIILAVQAANTDIANSDALQLAKEVDPNGDRTVGVITKLDLMDKGTDAMDVLQGKVIPLKLGYIGVVNRSQRDIDSKKDITAQWEAEKAYFRGATGEMAYTSIADKCGTQFLAQTLSRTLTGHIRKCLPEILSKIEKFTAEKREELAEQADLADEQGKQRVVLKSINGYAKSFDDIIEGNTSTIDDMSRELVGGAKVSHIFNDEFSAAIDAADFTSSISIDELRTIIRNCSGISGGLFIPDKSFSVAISRAISQLDAPCQRCVDDVSTELESILNRITSSSLDRFGTLADRIITTSKELLRRHTGECKRLVATLIQMELVRINHSHPDFAECRDIGSLIMEIKDEAEKKKKGGGGGGAAARAVSAGGRGAPPPLPVRPMSSGSGGSGGAGGGGGGSAADGVIMEGELMRKEEEGKGGIFKKSSWVRRHVVVANQALHWYPDSSKIAPCDGSGVSLDGAAVRWLEKEGGDFCFECKPRGGGHALAWRCQDSAEAQKWMQMLQVGKDQQTWDVYMSAMQAREETKSGGGGGGGGPPPPPTRRRGASIEKMRAKMNEGGLLGPTQSDKERIETELIARLLSTYYDIIRVKIQDSIPKAIMLMLVNKVKDEIHSQLISELYQLDQMNELLGEREEDVQKRKEVRACV